MEPLLINNEYLRRHSLWQRCASTLQEISGRDYPAKNYFDKLPKIDALDLDTYERSLYKNSTDCTGDAVIGIALQKVGNKLIKEFLLLIELRMGYTNACNLDLDEIRKKVEHSKDMINANGGVNLYQDYYFIFTDVEAPQANNLITRKANEKGRMTNYKVLSVSNFKNMLLDPKTLPYQPKHSEDEIIESFLATYRSPNDLNLNQFEKTFNYWMSKCQDFKLQYELLEAEHISNILKGEIVKAKNMIGKSESDLLIELEIMEEMLILC
jgi:hypothetical protein